jgi:hypothetical protein
MTHDHFLKQENSRNTMVTSSDAASDTSSMNQQRVKLEIVLSRQFGQVL